MPEPEDSEMLTGTLAAHGFILENLYALLLAGDARPVVACRNTAEAMLRDFAALRPVGTDKADAERVQRIIDLGYAELERFWIGVETRL